MNKNLLTQLIKNSEEELGNQKQLIDSLEKEVKTHKEYYTKNKKQLDELKAFLKSLEGSTSQN